MLPRQRKRIPGGRAFWTQTDPCPRMPEELWTSIQEEAIENCHLRLAAVNVKTCLIKYTGIVCKYEAQTGKSDQQRLWTLETPEGERKCYVNALEIPPSKTPLTIYCLQGEAPRFKRIQTTNPEWHHFQRNWPFHINEYYTPEKYYPEGIITYVTPLRENEIPCIVQVQNKEQIILQDNTLITRHGLKLH